MDQMDYTMAVDDTQQGRHHPNAAPGCQYHSPHPASNANSSGSQARDNQHYDPVHDATGWYPHSTLNTQHRSPFPPQNTQSPFAQNFSQWGGTGFTPSWQNSGDIQPGAQSQGQDPSGHRPQAGSMGMPPASWSDIPGYDLPFGYYSGSTTRPNNRSLADTTSGRSSAQVPATGADSALLSFSSAPTQVSTIQQQLSIARALSNRNNRTLTTSSNSAQQQTDPTTVTEASSRGPVPPSSLTELRNAHSRSARASRMSTWLDPPRRRTVGWDSDDDEESELAAEARSDIYLSQFMDDERILALHRGHMTGGKKVPTKAAIASLEPVQLEDLTDRVCSICYNEMGVSNPEGVTEVPLRLPKCHHTFGDKCIKKWFEDSDSCPYCRDTLPSEAPRRRMTAEEQMRTVQMLQQRARLHAASQSHRNRRTVPPQLPSSEDTSRSGPPSQQDPYDYVMSRAGDVWGHSPPNRASPGDSPESRRRQRGRIGSSRTPHMLGRPTSVGSARFVNPTSNHQSASQRAQVVGNTNQHGRPGLTRQGSSGGAPSTNTAQTTPPRNRLAASPEGASPPVADGSNDNSSERRSQQQFRDMHRQIDVFSQSFDDRLAESYSSRRSPSPSGSTPDSLLFMQRSHPSGYPPSFATSPPASYTDLQDREARYRREQIFQNTMNASSQPRWSQ